MTESANKSPKDDLTKSSEDQLESTNLTSRKTLLRRLQRGPDARAKFVDSHISKTLAFQIRALRGELSQEKAMEKLGMNQNAISRLENPYYGKATLTTLKRIASAYDVGLLVELVPFSRLVDRASGTPHTDNGLSPSTMNVPSFEEEIKQGFIDESSNKSEVALEFSRRYLGSTLVGVGDLSAQSAIEHRDESAAALNFTALPASGAIATALPEAPIGSNTPVPQNAPRETRSIHLPRTGIQVRNNWPRGVGRRLNSRRKRSSWRG